MAIIKNGKIHGKIGNYIYRVLDGVEIIQSYPRRTKQAGKPTMGNKRFGESSKTASKVYRIVKEFALNTIDGKFYGVLIALLRSNFYSDHSLAEDEKYDDWNLVPFDRFWSINKGPRLQQVLRLSPEANMSKNGCIVDLPKIEISSSFDKFIRRANYISYSIILIHYDFENDTAGIAFEYHSERMLMSRVPDAEELVITLDNLNPPAVKGLLMLCYGLRFFAMQNSYGYTNSKNFNPCGVLGVWYKR